jgi:hypothetical protein
MAVKQIKRIAYLFGAGATHAELLNLDPQLVRQSRGLLIGDVSSRVIRKARAEKSYLRDLEFVTGTAGGAAVDRVSGTSGSVNVELLISLLENSKIHNWAGKTELLKKLVQADIKGILTSQRTRRFLLHRALFELHSAKVARAKERVVGVISLNYDSVLDDAYRKYLGEPNYCLEAGSTSPTSKNVPLLKLHGSFDWSEGRLKGLRHPIEIIPLGSNKSYLHVPYSSIWNRALAILIQCDTLRVIGCSLSQNDAHLVDLLFKAHLERNSQLEMEVIAPVRAGETIRENYGFFPGIKTLLEIEGQLIPERNPENPFKTWLKYKSISMLGQTRIRRGAGPIGKVIG